MDCTAEGGEGRDRGKISSCFGYAEFQVPERDIQQAGERAGLDIWNWKLSVSRGRVKYIFCEGGNL